MIENRRTNGQHSNQKWFLIYFMVLKLVLIYLILNTRRDGSIRSSIGVGEDVSSKSSIRVGLDDSRKSSIRIG